ncbi:MAG: SecY-interacting protein [Shewanella sp.]|nr:SecY-interacting protein [Shewanella sp.]MCF1456541.1 SecY-interacting protein [Shewanella sp.]
MSCLSALQSFLNLYVNAYRSKLDEYPRYYPQGESSACVVSGDVQSDEAVQWQPARRYSPGNFSNVEQALELTLHPDINGFYGHFWSAPALFSCEQGEGELTGVWNQQDFEYLQQNIIGHLMMKRNLKQPLTWFIGLLDEGEKMLTINNEDGSVWTEVPGELQGEKLADSLAEFIAGLSPRVAVPFRHEHLPMPQLDHPGLLARLKIMWQNLTDKG